VCVGGGGVRVCVAGWGWVWVCVARWGWGLREHSAAGESHSRLLSRGEPVLLTSTSTCLIALHHIHARLPWLVGSTPWQMLYCILLLLH
jgi:hypothetical protein